MCKKQLCLILLLAAIFSYSLPVLAEGTLLENGSFESGSTGWSFSSSGVSVVSGGCDGEKALKITSASAALSPYAYTAPPVAGGSGYRLSLQIKEAQESTVKVRLRYYTAENKQLSSEEFICDNPAGGWYRNEVNFSAPAEAASVRIYTVLEGAGEVYFDKMELMKTSASENLVINGDFEEGKNGWNMYDASSVSFMEDGEGIYLKIAGTDGGKNPWVGRSVGGLVPGGMYTLSARVRSVSVTDGFGFKMEFLDASGSTVSESTELLSPTNSVWTEVSVSFTVPEDCVKMNLLARLFGAGEVYFDDIEVKKADKAFPAFFMVPETAFFYTENETGGVRIRENSGIYVFSADETLTLEVRDDSRVLTTVSQPAESGKRIVFPTAVLAEEGKAYTLRVSLRNADGAELYSSSDTVYRYDRPKALDAEGVFRTESGEAVYPTIGYHADSASFGRMAELGVNTVQMNASGSTEALLANMDKAAENGLYVLLNLYVDMYPAGHPNNAAHTCAVVEAVRDHSALFGYMLMDEPMANASRVGGTAAMYGYLKDSYTLIRDIDPVHPTYAVECYEGGFERTAACVDIFAVDMYPTSLAAMPDRTYSTTKKAVAAAVGKPVYHILQAYNLSGSYEPSSSDMRHMAYQAFFAGADGIGYYPVCDADSILWENELYNGVACFAAEEQENLRAAFVLGTAEIIARSEDESGLCSIVYKKEGKVYAAAINRAEEEKSFVASVGDGNVRLIGEDMAYAVADGTLSVAVSARGVFSCEVGGTPKVWVSKAGTTLYTYTAGEVKFCASGGQALFALYPAEGPREPLAVYVAGDTAVLPAGDYIVEGFSWDATMAPYTDKFLLIMR